MAVTSTNAAAKVRKVADHEFVDASGAVVGIEAATGFKYRTVDNPESGSVASDWFTHQLTDSSGAGLPVTMLALFGAKTKATNESSSNRQSRLKGGEEASNIGDTEAVADWFGELSQGNWPAEERTRGPRYDMARMAAAAAEMYKKAGSAVVGGAKALEEQFRVNEPLYAKIRTHPDVLAEYARLTAKAAKDAGKVQALPGLPDIG